MKLTLAQVYNQDKWYDDDMPAYSVVSEKAFEDPDEAEEWLKDEFARLKDEDISLKLCIDRRIIEKKEK